jgi:hypothetical protein
MLGGKISVWRFDNKTTSIKLWFLFHPMVVTQSILCPLNADSRGSIEFHHGPVWIADFNLQCRFQIIFRTIELGFVAEQMASFSRKRVVEAGPRSSHFSCGKYFLISFFPWHSILACELETMCWNIEITADVLMTEAECKNLQNISPTVACQDANH